jgi:hypothetical protein
MISTALIAVPSVPATDRTNDAGSLGAAWRGSMCHTNVELRHGAGDTNLIGDVWLENWANAKSSGEEYYDQIKAMKTGPIGFVGGGGNATPPAAPSNLRVE